MDELKITKAFAELNGDNLTEWNGMLITEFYDMGVKRTKEFNPVNDFTLTYQAMIKYNVRIMGHKIYIDSMRNKSTVVNEDINNPLSVAKSIIECILKHNNLWSEK